MMARFANPRLAFGARRANSKAAAPLSLALILVEKLDALAGRALIGDFMDKACRRMPPATARAPI